MTPGTQNSQGQQTFGEGPESDPRRPHGPRSVPTPTAQSARQPKGHRGPRFMYGHQNVHFT